MANTVVVVVPVNNEDKAATRINTNNRITIETPSGQVYISHDSVQGLFVTVRGEKATTTVKFNDKAVV